MNIIYNLYGETVSYFEFEKDYQIKSILLEGDWNKNIYNFIKKNSILGLYYNYTRGSAAKNFNFLNELQDLELLNIISTPVDDISDINGLTNLRVLSLQCHIKHPINFSNLQKLEKCSIPWIKGAESIFQLKNIKELSISSFPSKVLPNALDFKKIQKLSMYQSDLSELSRFKTLQTLKKLEIYNCRNLTDIDDLRFLKELEWLDIDGSHQIKDLSPISNLKNLRVLLISNIGKIPSISFVSKLRNLQVMAFCGSSYIEDGDLEPLTKLTRLSMLNFNGKRNYSHRLIKTWNWNNFDLPDKLLEKKSKKPHSA